MDLPTAHRLWSELHTAAKELKTGLDQISFMAKWAIEAEAALGCGSCWKRVKWFCSKYPITYGSELWLWTICLHDFVNKEVGRPLFYPDLTLARLKLKGIIQ